MKSSSSLYVLLAFLAVSGRPARAQGSDSCAAAQAIAGSGTFAVDNTAATTDGPADCNGQSTHKDVWYRWTAPSTGGFKLSLCGQVNFSTRVVVYSGTNCGSLVPIICAGANCTFHSVVSFSAVSGQQYLLRIGNRQSGASGGSGTFTLALDPCLSAQDDAYEENDDCFSVSPAGNGTFSNLFVRKFDEDWFEIPVPDAATVQIDVLFTHASGDIDIFLYQVCGDPPVAQSAGAVDNEQIVHTNSTGCLQRYKLRVQHYVPDANSDCNYYTMIISGSGTGGPTCNIGSNFCSSFSNSTGQAAVMSATGSASVGANDLVLVGQPTPNQPGLFFYAAGQTNGGNGIAFGNGLRCVGNATNPIFRLPVFQGSANQHLFAVDYNSLPSGGDITPGSTFHFQLWFRDPAGGGAFFDLSDGYTILFQV